MGREAAGPFIGRERELGLLLAGLREAATGRGGLFLVTGEPGIGKSRLAEEFAAAAGMSATVLSGRCWEAGGAPPYWPWVQALRAYVRETEVDRLRQHLGAGAADISQAIPDILQVLPDISPPAGEAREEARFRLFDSIATFVRNVARDRVVAIVLEDFHAADTPSMLLLEFIASGLTATGAVIVVTYRDVGAGANQRLTATLTEVARHTTTHHLELRGLALVEVGRFIEALTGERPSPGLVESVSRATEGNPLFTSEMVRLLAVEDRTVGDSPAVIRPLPEGIRAVIGRRLEFVSQSCRRLLEIASVLGRDFSLDVLSAVSEQPADELVGLLDESVAARLVSEPPGTLGVMRFSHSLVRDALYEELPPSQRMRLHRRAGEALERLRSGWPESLAQLAYHFTSAIPIIDHRKATSYAIRAAEHALAGLAFEEAARLYGIALQVMGAGERGDTKPRLEMLLTFGDALNRSGKADEARARFLEAAALAREAGDVHSLARAALGYGGRFSWTALRGDAYLVPLLEEALLALGDRRSRLRVMLIGRLAAGPLRDDPDPERRRKLSKDAVDVARAIGDSAGLVYALEARLWAIASPDTAEEMLQLCHEIEQLGLPLGEREKVHQARMGRLVVHMLQGHIHDAERERSEAVSVAERIRQAPQNWFTLVLDAELALLRGEFGEAERLSGNAYEAGRRAEPYALFAHRLQMLWIRREQERRSEVERIFHSMAEQFGAYPLWRSLQPYLLLDFGDADDARMFLQDVLARPRPMNEDWLLGEGALADAVASLGDGGAAAMLYPQLRPYAELTMGGAPNVNVGSMHRPLARLAWLLGDQSAADHHFRRAIELNDGMGAWPWAAHARHDYAVLLLARGASGDADTARVLQTEALGTARRLGMSALERRIAHPDVAGAPLARGPFAATGFEQVSAGSEPALDIRPLRSEFRREGEYWTVRFRADAFRLRDSKGLRHLACLLQQPSREFHVLDLATREAASSGRPDYGPRDVRLQETPEADLGPILDETAKSRFRARLLELDSDLEEATAWADAERANRIRDEKEFLVQQLAAAVGLYGRDRNTGSPTERCRVNITRAIKSALRRVREHNPELADHLDATIHTGTYCSYRPDPRAPISWQVSSQ